MRKIVAKNHAWLISAIGILSIVAGLSSCDLNRAEKEYLVAVRSDFNVIKQEMATISSLSQEEEATNKDQVQGITSMMEDFSAVQDIVKQAQTKRRTLITAVSDEEVKSLDKDLDTLYSDIIVFLDDNIPLLDFTKGIFKAMDRFERTMEMMNDNSETIAALTQTMQDMKSALTQVVLDLEELEIPTGKKGLEDFRTVAVTEFKKMIGLVNDMITALNNQDAYQIQATANRFEQWADEFDKIYQKKMDQTLQPELDAMETKANQLDAKRETIEDKMARLEGKFNIQLSPLSSDPTQTDNSSMTPEQEQQKDGKVTKKVQL